MVEAPGMTTVYDTKAGTDNLISRQAGTTCGLHRQPFFPATTTFSMEFMSLHFHSFSSPSPSTMPVDLIKPLCRVEAYTFIIIELVFILVGFASTLLPVTLENVTGSKHVDTAIGNVAFVCNLLAIMIPRYCVGHERVHGHSTSMRLRICNHFSALGPVPLLSVNFYVMVLKTGR